MINVKDPATFNHATCTLRNGHSYHYIDQAPAHSPPNSKPDPTCLLLHGFPDSWFGWRYHIKALSEAGFRVIAPTQLGYHPSSQPDDLKAYGYRALSTDLAEVLDKANVQDKVLLFGHDWGGLLAWRFAAYYPERVKAITVVCTPYMAPADGRRPYIELEELVEKQAPTFGYQLWFRTDEAADILQKNLETFLVPSFSQTPRRNPNPPSKAGKKPWTIPGEFRKRMMAADEMRTNGKITVEVPQVAQDPECVFYLELFRKGGLKCPLNYYKTRKICYDEEQASGISAIFPLRIPALFITGTNDEALPLDMSDSSPKYFAPGQYRREVFEGADHWMLQDARYRDKVSAMLVQWASTHNEEETTKAKL